MSNVLAHLLGPRTHAVALPRDSETNGRAAQFVGQRFTLASPIVNGHGRLTIGGATWLVSGSDQPAGTSVEVVGVEGPRLRVATP